MARIIPQLRTIDLSRTIEFYTSTLGFTLEFSYDDFYAGVRLGEALVHLKRVDVPDPSIEYVAEGGHLHLYIQVEDVAAVAASLRGRGAQMVDDVHETPWHTRECVIMDDQGHTLYFGQPL